MDIPVDANRRYYIKFSTDGAKLTKHFTGVQGTIWVMDVDDDLRVQFPTRLPGRFHREICVFYFLGMNTKIFIIYEAALEVLKE